MDGADRSVRQVAIVGLGLMGASFALALSRARPHLALVGVDSDPDTVSRAQALGIFASVSGELGAVAGADLILLAVPIRAMRRVLGELSPIAGEAVVTDMASTKSEVLMWAREAGVDLVGGHPMGGRERGGIEAARPDLFEGSSWLLARSQPAIEDLIRAVGAIPMVVDVNSHDRLVAGVSHAAFMVSAAYLLALRGDPAWPRMAELAGTGFRDMSRLAGGDPDMYGAIVETNRENVVAWLDATMEAMGELRRQLVEDHGGLHASFLRARQTRLTWEEQRARGG